MAVYTQLSDEEISSFLLQYPVASLDRAQGISAGVENTNYLLYLKDNTRRILTVFEKRVDERELPFFMELMQVVAQHIPSPMPLLAKDGKCILPIKGKPGVIVSFLEGRSTNAITPEHLTQLGGYLAKLHITALDCTMSRSNALSLRGWKDIFNAIAADLDRVVPNLSDMIAIEMAMLAKHWKLDLPSGIIHADLFPDNVFFNESKQLTGIIDFYFACNDSLAYDIAICMNAWCFEKDFQFNITKAKALLISYHRVRPLSDAELDALPLLARGAALRFLLTRAQDWLFPVAGALVTPKDPLEYLAKLRFHQQVKHHREYGL